MDIKLYSRNIDITEGLREQVNQKLSQITRHLPGITDFRVELAS